MCVVSVLVCLSVCLCVCAREGKAASVAGEASREEESDVGEDAGGN